MNLSIFVAKRESFLLLIAALLFFPLASHSQVILRCNLENKTVQTFHVKVDSDKPTVFREQQDGQLVQQGIPIITAEKIVFVTDEFLTELRRWYSSAQAQQAENSNNDAAISSLLQWRRKINESEASNTILINRVNMSISIGDSRLKGNCKRLQTPKTVF